MKKNIFIISVVIAAMSCNNQKPAETIVRLPSPFIDSVKNKFTVTMVDNKRDLVCGMPVTAGIGDTAHYKGKVYGFCSKECKDEFLKNPDSCLAKAK